METNVNFEQLLLGLLAKLSEREQNILKQRYYLTNNLSKKATLKQIGDVYSITRERVRQIEREAIRKLVELRKAEEFAGQLQLVESDVVGYLERNGGLVKEDFMLENFAKKNYAFDSLHLNAFLFVMDHLMDSVERLDNHAHFHPSWKLSNLELEQVVNLVNALEVKLGEDKKILSEADMLALSQSSLPAKLKDVLKGYTGKYQDLKVEDLLSAYLTATNRLEKNILNNWGLADWDKIQPKKLADKIMLIFEKETNPLHFREIAERINSAKFDHKSICPATVHNELIANDNYVLIGRGIYAMKDWGYTTGTVADIIETVLQSATKPMTKAEIFDAVLKQRQVNKSTIYLTLINKDQFVKDENGAFTLNK